MLALQLWGSLFLASAVAARLTASCWIYGMTHNRIQCDKLACTAYVERPGRLIESDRHFIHGLAFKEQIRRDLKRSIEALPLARGKGAQVDPILPESTGATTYTAKVTIWKANRHIFENDPMTEIDLPGVRHMGKATLKGCIAAYKEGVCCD